MSPVCRSLGESGYEGTPRYVGAHKLNQRSVLVERFSKDLGGFGGAGKPSCSENGAAVTRPLAPVWLGWRLFRARPGIYRVTVEINVSVAGQNSTLNCVRDGQLTVIQPLGMR